MGLTYQQQKALSIIPHFTGFASCVGSSFIIYEVVVDRKKWKKTYHRLLFAMSCYDLVGSAAAGLSTIPIPRGTQGVYYALGTTGTCTAQGFFVQLGASVSPLYNGMLALYYVLLVAKNMKEWEIRRSVEPYMHGVCTVLGFSFAFAGLGLDLYNNSTLWCWINDLPANCQGKYGEPGPVPCERGYNAWIYRWAFMFVPLWFAMILASVFMIILYRTVYQQEVRSSRYDMEAKTRTLTASEVLRAKKKKRKFERSKKVASQALFYMFFFYLTYIFSTINRLCQLIANRSFFVLLILHVIFAPLQGFFNFLVYVRPRFLQWRNRQRKSKMKAKSEEARVNQLAQRTNTAASNATENDHAGAGRGRAESSGTGHSEFYDWSRMETTGRSDYESMPDDDDDDSDDESSSSGDIAMESEKVPATELGVDEMGNPGTTEGFVVVAPGGK